MFSIDNPLNQKAMLIMNFGGTYLPYMYSSPQNELLGCRTGAWLGSMLNCSPVYELSGPDVVKLMNYVSVNRDYSTLPIGGSRHTILCNDKGQMLADGVLMRKDENRYFTYWLAPVLAYYVETLGYDVQGKWITDEFFIQIDGPRSLEIMEEVSGTDLHDLKFAKHKEISIAGVKTTIHRLGIWNRDLPITHTSQNHQRKKGNTFPASPSILSRRHNGVSLIRITFQAAHQYFQNQRKHCFLLHQRLINLITSSLPDQHLYFRVPV